MENEDTEKISTPGTKFSESIGDDGFGFLVESADLILDKFVTEGALDGVPILGSLVGGVRAVNALRHELYVRQVIRFLKGLERTTDEERNSFLRKLRSEGEIEHFGETMLLILRQVDDASKPTIMGRIFAAHISGAIPSYWTAMRLVSIVNRVYATDLHYLNSFSPGIQKDHDVAASLFSAGLLANIGIDDGSAEDSDTRYVYDLNEYGRILLLHGLQDNQ